MLTDPHHTNQNIHSTAAKLSSRAGTFGLTERAQEVGAIKSKEKEAAQKAELAAAIQVFGTDWNKMVKAAPYNGRWCVFVCVPVHPSPR